MASKNLFGHHLLGKSLNVLACVGPPGPTIRVLCLLFLNDLAQKLSSVIYMLDKIISSFVHHPFSTSLAMASRAIRLRSAALV